MSYVWAILVWNEAWERASYVAVGFVAGAFVFFILPSWLAYRRARREGRL